MESKSKQIYRQLDNCRNNRFYVNTFAIAVIYGYHIRNQTKASHKPYVPLTQSESDRSLVPELRVTCSLVYKAIHSLQHNFSLF